MENFAEKTQKTEYNNDSIALCIITICSEVQSNTTASPDLTLLEHVENPTDIGNYCQLSCSGEFGVGVTIANVLDITTSTTRVEFAFGFEGFSEGNPVISCISLSSTNGSPIFGSSSECGENPYSVSLNPNLKIGEQESFSLSFDLQIPPASNTFRCKIDPTIKVKTT